MWSGVSSLVFYLTTLLTFMILHLIVTMFCLGWVIIPHSSHFYYIATKIPHVALIGFVFIYYTGGYEKSNMIKKHNFNFFLTFFSWTFLLTLITICVDIIYGGVVIIPDAVDCFHPDHTPPDDLCQNDREKILYIIYIVVQSLHIIFGVIVAMFIIYVRSESPSNMEDYHRHKQQKHDEDSNNLALKLSNNNNYEEEDDLGDLRESLQEYRKKNLDNIRTQIFNKLKYDPNHTK